MDLKRLEHYIIINIAIFIYILFMIKNNFPNGIIIAPTAFVILIEYYYDFKISRNPIVIMLTSLQTTYMIISLESALNQNINLLIYNYIVHFIILFIIYGIDYILSLAKEKSQIDSLKSKLLTEKPELAEKKFLTCPKCGRRLLINKEKCFCGEKNHYHSMTQEEKNKIYVSEKDFSSTKYSEKTFIKKYIKEELKNNTYYKAGNVPQRLITTRVITLVITAIIIYLYISSIFFHFPVIFYILGLLVIAIMIFLISRLTTTGYFYKEIKRRPNEKINNIINSTLATSKKDNSYFVGITSILIGIVLPLCIFKNPIILYERQENGYAVRYYAYGWSNLKNATVPEKHNGKPVIALRGNSFSNMSLLESVTLPNSIKEIRGQAFLNDKNLKEVNLPVNLEYLGGSAFKNCTSINSIELPSKLKEIGGGAFSNCTNLGSITLPDSLEIMGGDTFKDDINLREVYLSKNLKEIRGNTFFNCQSLEKIELTNSIERIGGSAFEASGIKEVVFADNLKEIGGRAFAKCNNLYEISIPDSVVAIGGEAFMASEFLEEVKLPNYITEIRGDTFNSCGSLREITIPDSVTRIGGHAFHYCSSLESVNISENSSLRTIGSSAFRACYRLRIIKLPQNVIVENNSFKESPTEIITW